MTVYTGSAFDMAVNPFAVTGARLAIPLDERVRAARSTRGLFP